MNVQILTWAYEFLQRVDLNAKEVPAFLKVMQAFEDALNPAAEDTLEEVTDDFGEH